MSYTPHFPFLSLNCSCSGLPLNFLSLPLSIPSGQNPGVTPNPLFLLVPTCNPPANPVGLTSKYTQKGTCLTTLLAIRPVQPSPGSSNSLLTHGPTPGLLPTGIFSVQPSERSFLKAHPTQGGETLCDLSHILASWLPSCMTKSPLLVSPESRAPATPASSLWPPGTHLAASAHAASSACSASFHISHSSLPTPRFLLTFPVRSPSPLF